MSAAVRQRRAAAAQALTDDPRRALVAWHDLAAWPEWAALAPDRLQWLSLLAGVGIQAMAWQRCIDGALLQRLRDLIGSDALTAVLALDQPLSDPPGAVLPVADHLPDALRALGREVLLASVPSPPLRVVLRERFWPATLPLLPALPSDGAGRIVVWLARLDGVVQEMAR